jgi:BolA protein
MRKMKGVEMIKLERTADHIEKTLREAFNPQELEVSDVSEAHRGHSGFQEGGESHFEVRITAAHFSGMSRIAQHRAIHAGAGAGLYRADPRLGLNRARRLGSPRQPWGDFAITAPVWPPQSD